MRFVRFSERSSHSLVGDRSYIDSIAQTKRNVQSWKGRALVKDPMTLTTYLQLLQELKPRTVVEFGAYEGGSALWIKDMMDALGEPCEVHTIDINAIEVPDSIHFYQSDNYNIVDFLNENFDVFGQLEHPILLIEDSHENVFQVLWAMNYLLKSGDYIIIEDTLDPGKYEEMKYFLENADEFLVDTRYCDFWGHNNSWNVNSYLVKE